MVQENASSMHAGRRAVTGAQEETGHAEWRRTEARSPRYRELELWSAPDIVAAMLENQSQALHALWGAGDALAAAVEAASARLRTHEGRLVYVGAGTSGRIGMLDGVELPPTFGWPQKRIKFIFAGGQQGQSLAAEGAEDDADAGAAAMADAVIDQHDVVLGLAASGTTPFTRAALVAARKAGALTIAMANNPQSPMLADAEHAVLLDTGPEVLAGSTRLAAGTAQKIALNMFSTALMIGLKKVYAGQMVEMQPSNEKLRQRAIGMLQDITGCTGAAARAALENTQFAIKPAVLLIDGLSKIEADHLLAEKGGDLAAARSEVARFQK